MTILFILLMTPFSGVEATDGAAAPQAAVVDRGAWQAAIRSVFEQLDTLDMFALATKMGGIKVQVPKELQALPMRMIEGADELREKNIEILVKELEFRDLNFIYDKTPQWPGERPLVPTTVEFGILGVTADAKTKAYGDAAPALTYQYTGSLGATFRNGRLPVDFLPVIEKGYDLNLLPENRAADALLDDVQLQVGGNLTTKIANRFFSKRVAKLILEYGVGQTLQMGQKDLMTGDSALRLLDLPKDSKHGRVLEKVMEGVGR